MKTVLLLGVGPLPFYQTDKMYGFGIRAWQFALPILKAGHNIILVSCEFGIKRENQIKITYQFDPKVFGNLRHIAIPEPNPRNLNVLLSKIEEIIKINKPDVIVTAGSTIATNMAALLNTDLPIWMDMFGDLFAEVQAKSPYVSAKDQITFFHQVLSRVLLRGDRFSVVSEMQKGAAIGQLGLMGRLNQYTLGTDLVYTIPCAINGDIEPIKSAPILRGKVVRQDDFLILCSGGFNTWVDVTTLFESIEFAMEKNRDIHCIITGGGITGHHEDGYNRFKSLVSKSPYENRFHFLGWISNEEVAQVTKECNLGINIDLPIYESLLGSRNRMLYWMQYLLPIMTTTNTEISQVITGHQLAIGVETGGSKKIADKIVEASQDNTKLKKMALKAQQFVYKYFSFDVTSQPILDWIADANHAPDNEERSYQKGQPLNPVDAYWHAWAFPNEKQSTDASLPQPPKPIIKTRPQGKNWWRRLIGS